MQTKNLKLGSRKVSNLNFSKIVTLPKIFTENFLDVDMRVEMTLSHDGNLILSPIYISNNTIQEKN